MKRLGLISSFGLLAIVMIVSPSSATQILLYEAAFNTNGNFENWVDFGSRFSSYTVSGGVLAGTGGTVAGPHLRTAEGTFGALGLDMGAYLEVDLEIRMKRSTMQRINGGAHYLSFAGPTAGTAPGLPVINFNFTPTAANTFEVFTIDIKSIVDGLVNTDGVLRSLRLDPVGPSPFLGKTFEIDYIRIFGTIPEPTTLVLTAIGLAASCLCRRGNASTRMASKLSAELCY